MLIKKKYFYIIFFILISLTSFELLAADKFWVASDCSVTNYFDDSANWSLSANGSGGAQKPKRSDRAVFGWNASGSDCDAEIRRRADIQGLLVKGNYDGTVKVNDNKTLKIRQHFGLHGTILLGTDAKLNTNKYTSHIYSGGTLSAANAKEVRIFASLKIHSGGTFIAPAKATVFKGGFQNYGTFTHNSGTVYFSPKDSSYQVVTSGTGTGKDFYDVIKTGKNKFLKMNGDMQVNNITLSQGVLNVHGNDLYVKGNYISNGSNRREVTRTGQSTSVIFNGTGDQTIIARDTPGTWPSFENLTITNNSGYDGGGIAILGGNPVFTNVTITNNSAQDRGGGIYHESYGYIVNCI